MPRLAALAAALLLGPLRLLAQEALPVLPKSEFETRRARLLERLPDGVVVMEAEKILPGMDAIDANTPRYDYTYLLGYHREGDIVVLVPSEEAPIIFTDGDPAQLKKETGYANVVPRAEFATFAAEVLPASPLIYTRVRENALAAIAKAAGKATIRSTDKRGRNAIHAEISRMRMVKSDAELRMMKKAADATNRAHVAAMKACRAGMNEGELQKIIEDTFAREGCDGLGFPSIVGSGKNGTVLHYNDNRDPMPAQSLVVCDVGASYRGYVTDITRTLPTDGAFTKEQREAYECVLAAQKAAERKLRPGATFHELEEASRAVFEERKLTKWSYAHAKDFSVRHFLGHYVGMAVHDSGAGAAKFEPGMVITIEPGYYDKDRGWGIRIEDIYVVTSDGFTRLSADAPREVEEIEKLMKAARR